MYARELFGTLALGTLLLSGCSTDAAETALETAASAAPEERTAITFTCGQDETATRATYGHEGLMNSRELYNTGFGVFASQAAGSLPDIMYNQKVAFTFVGDLDDPLKGYWSYAPLKYWPNSETGIANFDICAYAPYVEQPPADDGERTGIIGMSANDGTTPYIIYRRANRTSEVVDLLWWCYAAPKQKETLKVDFRHALARVCLRLKAASVPANTKLLVKRITLNSTAMAQNGKLILNSQTVSGDNIYPEWQDQTTGDTEIIIDMDATSSDYYGVVDQQLRYRDGLPYPWQPDGVTDTPANALTTIDRQAYIYLIPQPELTFTCKVSFVKMTAASPTEVTEVTKTMTTSQTIAPLQGNTTYTLDLNLQDV